MINLIQFDSKKTEKIGLDASLKTSIVPDDAVIDLRNLMRDYYYFKDLQSGIVLKLIAELKVSFPAYLHMFSKVKTQTSLKLLEVYPLAADMLAAPKDELVETIRQTVRFGETYAISKYDALCAAIFERALQCNSLRIRLYIKAYREYQKHLDSILKELHKAVEKLDGTPVYDRIFFFQYRHGVGFLSAVILIAEMSSFDLFSSSKKFRSGSCRKAVGQVKVHMSKRGSRLARRILHMVTLNNLKIDKGTKTPVNPVIHSYYSDKCKNKKNNVAVGAVMHKICNIIFAMLRDNKSFELITSQQHCEWYLAAHPDKAHNIV